MVFVEPLGEGAVVAHDGRAGRDDVGDVVGDGSVFGFEVRRVHAVRHEHGVGADRCQVCHEVDGRADHQVGVVERLGVPPVEVVAPIDLFEHLEIVDVFVDGAGVDEMSSPGVVVDV